MGVMSAQHLFWWGIISLKLSNVVGVLSVNVHILGMGGSFNYFLIVWN